MQHQNHKILRYLSRYSIAEWKSCRLFVQMETKGKYPLAIYDALYISRSKSSQWNLEKIHAQQLSGISKKSFLNELSKLTLSVEAYLSYQESKSAPLHQRYFLYQYLLKQKEDDLFEKSFFKTIRELQKDESISINKNMAILKLLHQAFFSNHPIKVKYGSDLLAQIKSICTNTFEAYTESIDLTTDHFNSITKDYQKPLGQGSIASEIPLDLFDLTESLLTSYDPGQSAQIISLFLSIENQLDAMTMATLTGLLKKVYYHEIYYSDDPHLKSALSSILDIEYRSITERLGYPMNPVAISKYINAYISQGKIVEAKEIFDQYLAIYPDHQMDNHILISTAQIAIYEKEYDKAIQLLSSINAESIGLNIRVKAYTLICQMIKEQDNYDFLHAQITNFQAYIRYNKEKISQLNIDGHLGFGKVLQAIIDHKPADEIYSHLSERIAISSRSQLHHVMMERGL